MCRRNNRGFVQLGNDGRSVAHMIMILAWVKIKDI